MTNKLQDVCNSTDATLGGHTADVYAPAGSANVLADPAGAHVDSDVMPAGGTDAAAHGDTDEALVDDLHAERQDLEDDELRWKTLLGESLQVIVPALILALFVHFFLAQATVVYGQSMEPNLLQYQRLVVDKISYRTHPPQRDDIVVLDLPEMDEMLVKRVVGMPGERVEVREGLVYINGAPLPEPFPHDMVAYDMAEITLPPLHYFVLGDNRGNSNDSRSFGSIHRDHIVGRVWLRYWPLSQVTLF